MPYPALVVDRELRLVGVSDAVATRLGRSADDLHGVSLTDVVPDDQWAMLRPLYERALSGEAVHRPFVDLAGGRDGEAQLRSFSLEPIFDEDDAVVGLAGVFTDE